MIRIFDTHMFTCCYLGKHRWGRLVIWIEKASLENIGQLLEIIEVEPNHELLLKLRNLGELDACTFPYIIPVVPRLLAVELIKG